MASRICGVQKTSGSIQDTSEKAGDERIKLRFDCTLGASHICSVIKEGARLETLIKFFLHTLHFDE